MATQQTGITSQEFKSELSSEEIRTALKDIIKTLERDKQFFYGKFVADSEFEIRPALQRMLSLVPPKKRPTISLKIAETSTGCHITITQYEPNFLPLLALVPIFIGLFTILIIGEAWFLTLVVIGIIIAGCALLIYSSNPNVDQVMNLFAVQLKLLPVSKENQ